MPAYVATKLAMRNMCQFGRGRELDGYRNEIIELLSQNMTRKDVLKHLQALGYTGKSTSVKTYCRDLIAELELQFCSRKNTVGVAANPCQKPKMRYITRTVVLRHLWSGEHLGQSDIDYLFDKYPALVQLKATINDFREIYNEKNPQLLEIFINTHTQSSVKQIASFVNGLRSDIDAVSSSTTSSLSNGFVEGINNKVKLIKRSMYGRAKTQPPPPKGGGFIGAAEAA